MRSRVMPGSLVTMERRVPVKRLNRVDLPTLGRPTITRDGSFGDMFSGVEKLACARNVCRSFGPRVGGSKIGMTPPPGVFLRKNVILRELSCEIAQECDSKGFNAGRTDPAVGSELPKGLVEAITTHASTNC